MTPPNPAGTNYRAGRISLIQELARGSRVISRNLVSAVVALDVRGVRGYREEQRECVAVCTLEHRDGQSITNSIF